MKQLTEKQLSEIQSKARSNPNLRIQTVVGVYIECINKARKQGRPTRNLVRRLIKVLEDYPDIRY